jgi:hypothetical protein
MLTANSFSYIHSISYYSYRYASYGRSSLQPTQDAQAQAPQAQSTADQLAAMQSLLQQQGQRMATMMAAMQGAAAAMAPPPPPQGRLPTAYHHGGVQRGYNVQNCSQIQPVRPYLALRAHQHVGQAPWLPNDAETLYDDDSES